MQDAAPLANANPNSGIISNSNPTSPANSPADDSRLQVAVANFKKTGQVDQEVIDFARKQVLPKLGLSNEQINELGPVAVMVKLQQEEGKTSQNTVATDPTTTVPSKPNEVEKPVDLPNLAALSGNVDQLTDSLSSQIDLEIKRQMAEKNSLEQAQQKIDQSIKEHEELTIAPPVQDPEETPKPKIGLFQNQIQHNIAPKTQPPLGSVEVPDDQSAVDPLTASVDYAISSLQEGDQVGKDWTLRKILTTSFGNNKSPFYELVNKSGASWTLSPEEMKDVIRSNILSNNSTTIKEIRGEKTEPLHEISFPGEKTSEEQSVEETETKVQPENKPEDHQKHHFENKKDIHDDSKPFVRERSENHFEPKEEKEKMEPTKPEAKEAKLSQKQIDFVNKIHAEPTQWRTFVSFSPEQWTQVHRLYEAGNLSDIGINANPLFDRLSDSEFGELVDIHKGDTANKLLEKAGYNLSWTAEDAVIFGAHILANYKLLEFGLKKLEVSGISTEPLPTEKAIIELVVSSQNGNHEAIRKLQERLQLLPYDNKFKIIKPQRLDELRKYFRS